MLGRDLGGFAACRLARCDMTFIAVKLQIDTAQRGNTRDVEETWKSRLRADTLGR